jgi:hypothetical protein
VAVVGWAAFALWTALNTFGGWPPWDLPFALLGLFSGVRLLTAVYGHHRRRTTGDATPVRLVAAPAGWKTLGGLAAVAVAGVVLMPWTDGWSGLATAAAVAVLLGLLGWTILRLGRDWSRRWRGP